MSETADFDPGHWKGHSFKSARRAYDVHVDRSYGDAVAAKKNMKDLVPSTISTNSPAPLVILCDVTGSMGAWPATIFSTLPYLELEAPEYLGEDMEIAWGAIGDIFSDKYPFQMRKFTKGTKLKEELKELVIEGNGGGRQSESYEIAALYCANNIKMPKAVKPVLFIIGDEGFYDVITKANAEKYALVNTQSKIQAKDVFAELQRKFSVYLIRKPYSMWSGDSVSASDKVIYKQWEKVLGASRISVLPEAGRVVDVIFGILAEETDRVDYFKEEIEDRQKPGQVKTVMKALETIHQVGTVGDDKKLLRSGNSRMHKVGKSKKTKSLL
jgi:hypothetical protein